MKGKLIVKGHEGNVMMERALNAVGGEEIRLYAEEGGVVSVYGIAPVGELNIELNSIHYVAPANVFMSDICS